MGGRGGEEGVTRVSNLPPPLKKVKRKKRGAPGHLQHTSHKINIFLDPPLQGTLNEQEVTSLTSLKIYFLFCYNNFYVEVVVPLIIHSTYE